jgi:hypothetical protein
MSDSGVTLWIPGPWKDRSEFIADVARADSGVLAAGGLLVDVAAKRHAAFDVIERNGNLAKEIYIGSGRSLDRATLEAVDDHTSIACVTIDHTSDGLADRLDVFVRSVRAAGGTAVKVHKSGLGHAWERWEKELASETPGLFRLLVVQVRDPQAGRTSSFGMKQFDLPDARIEDDGSDPEAAWVLFEFNIYLRSEKPHLQTGHAFSRALPGATRYRLSYAVDERYPQGHPYFNSHGIWDLRRQ